jgi:hypothetical protein
MYSNIYRISLLDRNQLLLLSTLAIVVLLAATHSYAYYIVSNTLPKWKRSIRGLIIGLTLPIYWALYWAATLRAIYQIYTGNLIWEKTKHHGRNKEVSKDMREDEE